MRANIISIGNSKGIRLPKVILKQFGIDEQVDIEVAKDKIIIKPVKIRPREVWDKAFKLMHERSEDALMIEENTDIDMEGWEWK